MIFYLTLGEGSKSLLGKPVCPYCSGSGFGPDQVLLIIGPKMITHTFLGSSDLIFKIQSCFTIRSYPREASALIFRSDLALQEQILQIRHFLLILCLFL